MECGKRAHALSHEVHKTVKHKEIAQNALWHEGLCDVCLNIREVTNKSSYENSDFSLLP